jgi:hypothetical protein
LTDLSSNGGSFLNKGETLPIVLIEIIQTLDKEIKSVRTEKIKSMRDKENIFDEYFGKDFEKYKKLKVSYFNNTDNQF